MDQTSETEKVYQRTKYEEIIEILLTAGYFRARINTLSEFDKVVGGLCWCLISSGEAVDVDILFQENSTIGQKIALSEAIVNALRKMGCPAMLQPHQIQGGVGGSDYPALQLVIVWLVKKYFERRGEREQQLRAFSTFQFSKNYQIPDEGTSGSSDTFLKILGRNKATRLYRRNESAGESEETKVRSCLLEFGESFSVGGAGGSGAGAAGSGAGTNVSAGGGANDGSAPGGLAASAAAAAANRAARQGDAGSGAGGGLLGGGGGGGAADVTLGGLAKLDINELSAFEKQLARTAREAKKEEALLAAQLSKEEAQLRQQMKTLDEGGGSGGGGVSGSQVGNIVGLGMGEIGSALAAYQAELEESRKQLDSSMASGKLGQQAAFNRQKQNLLKQRDELSAKEREARIATDAMMEKLSLIEEERDSALEYIGQLKAQIKKLCDLEAASSQQEELATVQRLVAKHDSLKTEEAAFKAKCKAQRQEYIDKIAALDADLGEDTEENAKLRDVEDMHAKVRTGI
jgi:hypothetical protein